MTQDSNSPSQWVKTLSQAGKIRAVGIEATDLVQQLVDRHHLASPWLVRALGEAVIAGIMMGSNCKEGERANIKIEGNGLAKIASVDADPEGRVRGYVVPNDAQNVSSEALQGERGYWGQGSLSVTRSYEKAGKQPYIGTTALETGWLGQDLTHYWLQSEQVHSAVCLQVRHEESQIQAAFGCLVQAMPGADENELQSIESSLKTAPEQVLNEMAEAQDPVEILTPILGSVSSMVLERKKLFFECRCSQQKVENSIKLLGAKELEELIEKGEPAEVDCEFCSEHYSVNLERMKELKAELD